MNKRIFILLAAAVVSAHALAQSSPAPSDANYYQQAEVDHTVYVILRKMDSGDYGALWRKTSPVARGGMTEGSWTGAIASMRKTFGSYKNRKAERYGYSDQLSSGEKGRFYAAIFQTQFSTTQVEEKIVLSLEEGEWKLAGYFMKPNPTK